MVRYRYPSASSGKEWDYVVIAFDGFHEFLENLEVKPAGGGASKDASKDAGKDAGGGSSSNSELMDILMQWVVRNSKMAHVMFCGESNFGEETLLQSMHCTTSSLVSYYL